MTLIGGNLSESIFACNSKLDVLIKDSVAIALVIPDDGNPLTNVPPSKSIGTISLISMSLVILYSIHCM